MTHYPSYAAAIQLHFYLIEQFGGSHGVRDSGGLKSALARPRAGYYNDLIEEAAALMESLSQNHPFIDGNKRTAIAVGISFLERNGYEAGFDDHQAYKFFIELYEAGKFNFRSLDKWLRKHVRS